MSDLITGLFYVYRDSGKPPRGNYNSLVLDIDYKECKYKRYMSCANFSKKPNYAETVDEKTIHDYIGYLVSIGFTEIKE